MKIQLSGIFEINTRIGNMVEIVKTVIGVKTYTLVHEKDISIEDNKVLIEKEIIKKQSWFFRKIK